MTNNGEVPGAELARVKRDEGLKPCHFRRLIFWVVILGARVDILPSRSSHLSAVRRINDFARSLDGSFGTRRLTAALFFREFLLE